MHQCGLHCRSRKLDCQLLVARQHYLRHPDGCSLMDRESTSFSRVLGGARASHGNSYANREPGLALHHAPTHPVPSPDNRIAKRPTFGPQQAGSADRRVPSRPVPSAHLHSAGGGSTTPRSNQHQIALPGGARQILQFAIQRLNVGLWCSPGFDCPGMANSWDQGHAVKSPAWKQLHPALPPSAHDLRSTGHQSESSPNSPCQRTHHGSVDTAQMKT